MSKELFQLIKSLSQSEKRYFKLHTARHVDPEKSIAIEIFDTLALQKEYDNKLLTKKISIKNRAHLPMYKRMLQNMLMRELSLYHSTITPQSRIRGLLDECDILFHKELYTMCKKAIIKAKHLATKYETFTYLAEILHFEIKTEKALGGNDPSLVLDVYNNEIAALEKQKNIVEYAKLSEDLHSYIREHKGVRTPDDKMTIKRIMENALFENEERAMSEYAKVIHFYCKGAAAYIDGDAKKVNYYIGKQLDLLNNNPHLIELNPMGYVGVLTNLAITTFQMGKYDEVELQIKKIREIILSLPEKLKHNINNNLLNLQNVLLEMYNRIGQFEKGTSFAENIDRDINTDDRSGVDKLGLIQFLFNMTYLNFGLPNYKKAHFYANQLIQLKGIELRLDLQLFARIINIIIYFELGELEIIPHLTKSLYRQLIQKKKLYKAEELIVNWIRIKLPKIKNNNDLIKSFVELKENLEQIVSDPLEAKSLEYFDFISWLKSKIEKRSFAECVRQRAISSTKG